ncbi:hypothetical protein B4U80_05841 [Leptotrombidium deliense]|uniref:Uncharacterized protein n=1 Tax=Leptotrombidium deliense TaxID=299467 RepID=A0A443SL50_9ACAR|nr:hypothetical protein B4U80_05841 [Leptotrombidium deliense]
MAEESLQHNGNNNKNTRCLKFSLMVCNSFGIVIGVFVVLFGLAYSTVTFPGGYDGNNTAIFASFFILFSFVGYCGAHRLSFWLLLSYALVICGFLSTYLVKWLLKSDVTCLDAKAYAIIFLSGLFLAMMITAFTLSHKVRKMRAASQAAAARDFMQKSSMNTSSNTASTFVSLPKFQNKK